MYALKEAASDAHKDGLTLPFQKVFDWETLSKLEKVMTNWKCCSVVHLNSNDTWYLQN